MHVIIGHLQEYAWGMPGGLNPWLPTPAGDAPQAELWFGAHPHGPSRLRDGAGTLADVVEPGEVPLLVKLLAADKPLSIQIHPPRELAAEMFMSGSPLVSDDEAKVEMLVAIDRFAVFAGWRDPDVAAAWLRGTDPRLAAAAAAVAADDIRTAVRRLLAVPADEVDELTPALLAAAASVGVDEDSQVAMALAARNFPGDAGLLVLALLDHRVLAPGEAVYMPAGGVHSYARGFGLEVMTASDNVLRLGLTGKTIAVDEALAALSDHGDPHFLGADVHMDHGQRVMTSYRPYEAPFSVEMVRASEAIAFGGVYRCVLAVDGSASITSGPHVVTLQQGHACAILAGEPDVEVSTSGTAAVIEARGVR